MLVAGRRSAPSPDLNTSIGRKYPGWWQWKQFLSATVGIGLFGSLQIFELWPIFPLLKHIRFEYSGFSGADLLTSSESVVCCCNCAAFCSETIAAANRSSTLDCCICADFRAKPSSLTAPQFSSDSQPGLPLSASVRSSASPQPYVGISDSTPIG